MFDEFLCALLFLLQLQVAIDSNIILCFMHTPGRRAHVVFSSGRKKIADLCRTLLVDVNIIHLLPVEI